VAGSDEPEVHELEDVRFEGPNTDLPSPPADLPYARYEDWRSVALLAVLAVNGIPETEEALLEALRTQENILLSAAAHACGSLALHRAAPRLREVARGPDDYAGVEAAYALARLGEEDGAGLLREALERPLAAYLSPVLAAGHLAQLGDPSGFPVVLAGLDGELLATKMLACKQLYFFARYDDVDAVAALERAAEDPDPSVGRQARVQLRELGLG
jgi:hypothetical protein